MSGKSKEQKVSIVEKMGLFMVCAGNIPLMGLLSGFFMIYYTNVVGLEPAALATLFLISKVVDGISDPIMGYFLDKFPVTKMGKFDLVFQKGQMFKSLLEKQRMKLTKT